MKLYELRKIKHLILLLIGLVTIVLIKLFIYPERTALDYQPRIEIQTDTIWQTRIDTFELQTTTYKPVYVHTYDTIEKEIYMDSLLVNMYLDTLRTEDISIYGKQFVSGTLVKGELNYTLHVPREIIRTETQYIAEKSKSHLSIYTEAGGFLSGNQNLGFGLLYVNKNKWLITGRINTWPLHNPSYHLGIGYRLL